VDSGELQYVNKLRGGSVLSGANNDMIVASGSSASSHTASERMRSMCEDLRSSSVVSLGNQVGTYNATLDVKEMPMNPFDFIWYSNKLKEDTNFKILTNSENGQSSSSHNWSFGSVPSNHQMFSYDELMNNSNLEFHIVPNLKARSAKKEKKAKDKEKKPKKSKKDKNKNSDCSNNLD
jgi:hypothetical protein